MKVMKIYQLQKNNENLEVNNFKKKNYKMYYLKENIT